MIMFCHVFLIFQVDAINMLQLIISLIMRALVIKSLIIVLNKHQLKHKTFDEAMNINGDAAYYIETEYDISEKNLFDF